MAESPGEQLKPVAARKFICSLGLCRNVRATNKCRWEQKKEVSSSPNIWSDLR